VNTLLQGWPKARLRYSKWTAGDLILGVLLAIHLLAAHGSKFRIGRMAHPIAVVATATFSIYLMHFPLLEFWAGYEQLSPGLLLAAVLVSIMPIWLLTEVARRRLQVLLLQVLDGAVGFRRALQGTGAPRRQASSAGPALSLHEAKARLIDVAVGD
jgi:peptidoglycan/LPS O-acetylase OafA/YrhL